MYEDVHIEENVDSVFLISVNEMMKNLNVEELQKKLKHYKLTYGDKNYLLIVNSWFKCYDSEFKKFKLNVVYIDQWLKYTYEKLFLEKLSPVRTKFSYNKNNSFLFLMGKSYKRNRICLFYHLLTKGCIKKNTFYTLRRNEHEESFREAFNIMKDLIRTKKNLTQFFSAYQKEIDVIYDKNVHDHELHYMGIPYNVDMFLNSNFQIIPESDTTSIWVTEKTWISIANKMPFMLVGSKNACAYLESLGFKTFREYMKYPNYDEHDDYDLVLEQVVENVQHWERKLHKFSDVMEQDVEHNFRIFEDRYFNYLKTADYICENYAINKDFLNNEILGGYHNHYPVKITT
jgi:hypothetical protein